jgi:hypothetical protein
VGAVAVQNRKFEKIRILSDKNKLKIEEKFSHLYLEFCNKIRLEICLKKEKTVQTFREKKQIRRLPMERGAENGLIMKDAQKLVLKFWHSK